MNTKIKFTFLFSSLLFTGLFFWTNSADAAFDAGFVSQSVPSTMNAGSVYNVTVTYLNRGDEEWFCCSPPTGDPYTIAGFKLGSQNPQDNETWGSGKARVLLPSTVTAGQQVTFSFTVTAPSTPSTYAFQWRMVCDNCGFGAPGWFGDYSPLINVTVSVDPGPAPTCNAGGANPVGDWTIATSGTRSAFAASVANATAVSFGAWSDVGGTDDAVWYTGTNQGGGVWKADINLASHPGLGTINTVIYAVKSGFADVYCGNAYFTRLNNGTINVNSNLPTSWTITCTLTNPVCPPVNSLSNITTGTYPTKPYSTWTIVPEAKTGYDVTVTPNTVQAFP